MLTKEQLFNLIYTEAKTKMTDDNPLHVRAIEILLVEDNPGDAELTAEALKESKIKNRLHIVEDGEQALLYLRKKEGYEEAILPDLILLDLNLPRKDGREVLEEIKFDPSLRKIPVVVLTTSQAEEDIMRSYDLHANCFVSKPIDFEQFNKVVRKIEQFWFSIVILPSHKD